MLAADAAAQAAGLRVGMPATQGPGAGPGPGRFRTPIRPPTRRRSIGWRCGCSGISRRSSPPIRRTASSSTPPAPIICMAAKTAMLAALVERLAASGMRARAAIADSWGAAHALARFVLGAGYVSEPGKAASDIAPLADRGACASARSWSAAFACSASSASASLLAQPRAPLALRFGPELGRRLDQALGQIAEPIEPIRPEELIEVRRAFAEPIGAAETIARYIGKLAAQLCDELGAQGPRRAAARSHLPSRRQPRAGGARRHGPAGARRQAHDAAAVRQDRNHRSRLRHRVDDARGHRDRAACAEAGRVEPDRRAASPTSRA